MIVSRWISKKIKPGESWVLGNKHDPWGDSYEATVFVLDVQDGWVRYCWEYPDGSFGSGRFSKTAFDFWSIFYKINS